MKRCIPILLALLLLAGCEREERVPTMTPTPIQSPAPNESETMEPPAPTSVSTHEPVGVEVDIGDGEHTFWVEAVDTGEPTFEGTVLLVNIYRNQEDTEPVQCFEEELGMGSPEIASVDVDFDGDTDLSVLLHSYRSVEQRVYYIWDQTKGKFVEDPYELRRLNRAEFDSEREIIQSSIWDTLSGTISYSRYEEDHLICVRYLSWSSKGEGMYLFVADGWDGELTAVYETTATVDELVEGMVGTEEFFRWEDLDYHGETK